VPDLPVRITHTSTLETDLETLLGNAVSTHVEERGTTNAEIDFLELED
jgi:hypothetical protein